MGRKDINLQSTDSSKFQGQATTISSQLIQGHPIGGASEGFTSNPSLAYPGGTQTKTQKASVLSDTQGNQFATTTIGDPTVSASYNAQNSPLYQRPKTAGNTVKTMNLIVVQSNEAPLSTEYVQVGEG